MLAQMLTQLLPPLTYQQVLNTTAIHSLIGNNEHQLILRPVCRQPHHTVSSAGLLGGGSKLLPGEVSLAHNGILFLDELTEFNSNLLNALRQPLELGQINLVRQPGSVTYPARFQLVAATNPCPCGWYQSSIKTCQCSISRRQHYWHKISGPVLDRIDLQVWLDMPKSKIDVKSQSNQQNSQEMIDQIDRSRKIQLAKLEKFSKTLNCQLTSKEIFQLINLDNDSKILLHQAQAKLGFSMRGLISALRVALTISQLDGHKALNHRHLAEALQYRQLEKLATT